MKQSDKILYQEHNGGTTTIEKGDIIQITRLERRYRSSTPTTTNDIEKYPDGLKFDITQEIKVVKDSYVEDTTLVDSVTFIVFEDDSELSGHKIVTEIHNQPQLIRDELNEHLTIYEKHNRGVNDE